VLKYGIFDWLEHQEAVPLDQVFEQRLLMLEQADRTGFYAYHVAEHQGTPLSLDSSPSVFLAAATQRTTQLRLAPTVYCLPWYNPFRLYNEICLLDQLSKGRLEIGIGRGVSPIESAYYGVTSMEQGREMAAEALDVIVRACKSDKLDYSGKYYSYEGIELWNKPYQKPYPPLWYPTSNIESVPYVAKEGYSTSHNFAPNDVAKPHIALYKEELAKHAGNPDRLNAHVKEPLISNSRHIYVAPTDAEAIEQAGPAFDVWSEHISHLSGRFSDRPRDSLALQKRMDNGTALVGSPETVRKAIQEMVDETGINYFLGVFYFGDLPLDRVLRSMELFTNQVIAQIEVSEPSTVGS
jgi:alkanesulfonate monooxygenase SsuD/methylene tetrahydromethanopterin reductase-like flavin-dependent oxidoreductase (luciferase family)